MKKKLADWLAQLSFKEKINDFKVSIIVRAHKPNQIIIRCLKTTPATALVTRNADHK